MPIYEFDCASCGGFSVLKTLAKRNDAQACPACGGPAQRNLVSAPTLACMSSTARHAAEINERSRHEPLHSHDAHHHGAHCSGASKPADASSGVGAAKTFPGRRPWMISH